MLFKQFQNKKVSKQATMKSFIPAIAFILLSFLAIQLFSSCKTSKDAGKQDFILFLLLEERLDASYLESNYIDYKPTDIVRSNRTLNQYRTKFNCSEKQGVELLKRLETDAKVVEITKADKSGVEIQSGTNQKSSKVGPIRKN